MQKANARSTHLRPDRIEKSKPLISCLMVTANRSDFVRRSLWCYAAQKYLNTELVIVDSGVEPLSQQFDFGAYRNVRYVRVPPHPKLTIGELRNISLQSATGEYTVTWDDDDYHAPERLLLQQAAVQGFDVSFLYRVTIGLPGRGLYAISRRGGWECSMIARRSLGIEYPALNRGEDTAVVRRLLDSGVSVTSLERPDLYLYLFHGKNTVNEAHFLKFFSEKGAVELKWENLRKEAREHIGSMLAGELAARDPICRTDAPRA